MFSWTVCPNRREYHRRCETAGKSGKQIERCVLSTFQIAERMEFKNEFRQWRNSSGSEIDRLAH